MEAAKVFIDKYKHSTNRDLRVGANWDIIREYALFLKNTGSPLWYKKLLYNWVRESATGIGIVKRLGLPDGFYIVGAFRADALGHCFVLRVRNGAFVVCENGQEEVEAYGEWVSELRFVRRVVFIDS
jgi:hypothetical protein